MDNRPCRIDHVDHHHEHGHTKFHVVGKDIFSGRKHEWTVPHSHHQIPVPNVHHHKYLLTNISDDNYASLLDDHGDETTREDLKVPDNEMGRKLKNHFEKGEQVHVLVMRYGDEEHIMNFHLDK